MESQREKGRNEYKDRLSGFSYESPMVPLSKFSVETTDKPSKCGDR